MRKHSHQWWRSEAVDVDARDRLISYRSLAFSYRDKVPVLADKPSHCFHEEASPTKFHLMSLSQWSDATCKLSIFSFICRSELWERSAFGYVYAYQHRFGALLYDGKHTKRLTSTNSSHASNQTEDEKTRTKHADRSDSTRWLSCNTSPTSFHLPGITNPITPFSWDWIEWIRFRCRWPNILSRPDIWRPRLDANVLLFLHSLTRFLTSSDRGMYSEARRQRHMGSIQLEEKMDRQTLKDACFARVTVTWTPEILEARSAPAWHEMLALRGQASTLTRIQQARFFQTSISERNRRLPHFAMSTALLEAALSRRCSIQISSFLGRTCGI